MGEHFWIIRRSFTVQRLVTAMNMTRTIYQHSSQDEVAIQSNQVDHLTSRNPLPFPTCIYHCYNELVCPSVHLATVLHRCTNSTRKGSSVDVHAIHCPSCGETLDVAIDWSVNHQEYIEDCQVCCRPMVLQITVDEERNAEITVRVETD